MKFRKPPKSTSAKQTARSKKYEKISKARKTIEKGMAISRVLSWVIIYLLQILQFGSSEGFDIRLKTIPSCCELGLYSRRACTPRRWALTPPFHLYRRSGSLLSVTLSLGSPQPSVRWNSVLLQLGLSSFACAKAITCHTLGAIIAFSGLRIAFKALATFDAIFKIWPLCKSRCL